MAQIVEHPGKFRNGMKLSVKALAGKPRLFQLLSQPVPLPRLAGRPGQKPFPPISADLGKKCQSIIGKPNKPVLIISSPFP